MFRIFNVKVDLKGFMPGFIAVVFLTFFGLATFGKYVFGSTFEVDTDTKQTLINLTIASVMYYIGTTQASSKKDDTIAGMTPKPPPLPTGTSSTTTTTTTTAEDKTEDKPA